MTTVIGIGVPIVSFVLLVAVGMDLTTSDFVRVARQRALVLTGLLAPLLLLPCLAVGLTRLLPLSPEATTGLLLIAACPVGGMSNVFSYLARASPALSVTLTGLSCLAATVTIPAVSAGLSLFLDRPLGVSAPLSVLIGQLLLVLAVPVALGVAIRRWLPHPAHRYRVPLQRLSFIGVSVVLVLVATNDARAFARELGSTVPLAVAFIVGSWSIGWLTSLLVTRDARDRFTLAVEFGTRHVGIATVLAVTVLGRVEFARFGATYFMTEMPVMLAAVALFRRFNDRAAMTVAGTR